MNKNQTCKLLLFFLLIPFLSSCFQVIEEINLKNDGSGDVILTINLSESKTKVASIMLADSINGYRVPSKQKIVQQLNEAAAYLRKTPGISQVKTSTDFNNYVATIGFSFQDISNINNLTKDILAKQKIKATNNSSYSYNKTTGIFNRQYQPLNDAKQAYSKLKNQDKTVFKTAMYTSIYRFERPVSSISNPLANLSKTQKAVMLKSSILDLINGTVNISNRIQLSP